MFQAKWTKQDLSGQSKFENEQDALAWLEQVKSALKMFEDRWVPENSLGSLGLNIADSTNSRTINDELHGELVTEYFFPKNYTTEIKDISQDYDYLLEKCYIRRAKKYPSFLDYIDGVVKNDQAQINKYIADCLAVKAEEPKPVKL